MNNYKIFIGYSNEDNDKAQYLHNCLQRIVEFIPIKPNFTKHMVKTLN